MKQKTKKQIIDADAIKQSVITGYKEATKQFKDYEASQPCLELLKDIAEKVDKDKINIERMLHTEGYKTPNRAQRVGKFIDLFCDISANSGHPVSILNGKPSYYNGKCWESLGETDMGYFITCAAQLLGVDHYEAEFCDYVRKVRDSLSTARRTSPASSQGMSLLNCNNGTVEITETGANLREHNPKDGLQYVLPYDYNQQATAPQFEKFLKEVLPENADRANLQEFMGSCFSPIKTEKSAYLYGATGNNGKSTFKDIIVGALGDMNVSSASLSDLTRSDLTGFSSRALLEGKILNTCGEADTKISESDTFKKLATREELEVRGLYEKIRHLPRNSYARLMFVGNSLPTFTQGASKAEAKRFLFIEFAQRIPDSKIDRHLNEKIIRSELPGVLNWIIEGLIRLCKNEGKFTPNPHADEIAFQFLEASNNVVAWLNEYNIRPDNAETRTRYPNATALQPKVTSLFNTGDFITGVESYQQYCNANGRKFQGRNKFIESLKQVGFTVGHNKQGSVVRILIVSAEDLEKERNRKNANLIF